MLFNHTLKALEGFTSVRIYNEIQRIKKVILNDIANGNGTNDYLYIFNDLKMKYREISTVYEKLLSFNLSTPEKYYEESLDSMNKLMTLYDDECISIKKTNLDYKNELKTSNYYIYKQITWRTGELFKEIEVIRYKNKTKGITPLLIHKYKDASSAASDDKSKKQSSLYIGPMDIAFYDFYSTKYFLKNSFLLHELIKYERIIHKRIMYEVDYIFKNQLATFNPSDSEFCWSVKKMSIKAIEEDIKRDYLTISIKRYGLYFNTDFEEILRKICDTWELWCKRHNLIFDYFMAIRFLEYEEELRTQIDLSNKDLILKDTLESGPSVNIEIEVIKNKIKLYKDISDSREKFSNLHNFYSDIRDSFFKRYSNINTTIKSLYREISKPK